MSTEKPQLRLPCNAVVLRYREHLRVIDEGPATVDQFRKSPYFVSNSTPSTMHPAWHWDDYQMRVDQAALARAFIEARPDAYPIFDILPRLWASGHATKKQDGTWWLFRSDGEGLISGRTFRELCVNIVLAGV